MAKTAEKTPKGAERPGLLDRLRGCGNAEGEPQRRCWLHEKLHSACAAGEPENVIRQKLLDAGTELFARKGYAATSVREIVAAAGVSAPVLYYYFGNKEGLYLEILQGAGEHFASLLTEIESQPGSAREGLLALSLSTLRLFRERLEVGKMIYAITFGPPQGAPFFDAHGIHEVLKNTYRALVERGAATGEFRKGCEDALVYALMGAVTHVMEYEICHPEEGVGEKELCEMSEIIFRGAAPSGRENG